MQHSDQRKKGSAGVARLQARFSSGTTRLTDGRVMPSIAGTLGISPPARYRMLTERKGEVAE